MNRGFLSEQLPLLGSSSFPETRLTAYSTSLGLLCLQNIMQVSRLYQRSASPKVSSCDPHPFLCLFLTNMDYLLGCGEDYCIEKSRDHSTSELQDSRHGCFFQRLSWPFKPLLAFATSIGTTKGWQFATTVLRPKPAQSW